MAVRSSTRFKGRPRAPVDFGTPLRDGEVARVLSPIACADGGRRGCWAWPRLWGFALADASADGLAKAIVEAAIGLGRALEGREPQRLGEAIADAVSEGLVNRT